MRCVVSHVVAVVIDCVVVVGIIAVVEVLVAVVAVVVGFDTFDFAFFIAWEFFSVVHS